METDKMLKFWVWVTAHFDSSDIINRACCSVDVTTMLCAWCCYSTDMTLIKLFIAARASFTFSLSPTYYVLFGDIRLLLDNQPLLGWEFLLPFCLLNEPKMSLQYDTKSGKLRPSHWLRSLLLFRAWARPASDWVTTNQSTELSNWQRPTAHSQPLTHYYPFCFTRGNYILRKQNSR